MEETSKDSSGNFMTQCQKQVVSFDDFKDSIASDWGTRPKSCDALYQYDADTWFLIEFKNGRLEDMRQAPPEDTKEIRDVVRKFFESLLLLTKQLGQTIDFTHKNFVFILVYNENKNNGYLAIKDAAKRLGRSKRMSKDILPMCYLSEVLGTHNTAYFDKLYVKRAYICSQQSFNEEFVKKYAQ